MRVVRRRCLRVLAALLIVGPPRSAAAQTIPEDDPPATTTRRPDTRRQLSRQDSLQRIKQAQDLLRQGGLAESEAKLRGKDFVVRLERDFDPRDVAFVYALTAYRDGKLRAAYTSAGDIQRVRKPGEVNNDAALLKALIFARAGIYPLAARWANSILKTNPAHIGAIGVLNALGDRQGRDYSLEQTVSAEGVPDHQIDVWSSASSSQRIVLSVRKNDDFRGAFTLEQVASQPAPAYVLRYYDLEGRPLVITYLGEAPLSSSEMLVRIKGLNPQPGKGRYSIMRAELEALAWLRAGVPPYAAKWAAYASPASALAADKVRRPLEAAQAWSWEPAGTQSAFLPDSFQAVELRAFANRARRDARGPLEDYHIVVVSKGKYLASFAVDSSEPIPGERVYRLNFFINGVRRPIKYYDDLEPPAIMRVVDDVKDALAGGLSSQARGSGSERGLLAEAIPTFP